MSDFLKDFGLYTGLKELNNKNVRAALNFAVLCLEEKLKSHKPGDALLDEVYNFTMKNYIDNLNELDDLLKAIEERK